MPYEILDRIVVRSAGSELERHWLFDVYEGKGLPEGKHALGITLQQPLWNGGLGVFLGFREASHRDQPCAKRALALAPMPSWKGACARTAIGCARPSPTRSRATAGSRASDAMLIEMRDIERVYHLGRSEDVHALCGVPRHPRGMAA